MKLQLISDLHLEFYDLPLRVLDHLEIESGLDFLVVAGDTIVVARDIQPDAIFRRLSQFARHVIWIEGNHEYYHAEDSGRARYHLASYIARYPNIHWLCNEEITIEGVHFFGGALWFRDEDGLNSLHEDVLNDFKLIPDLKRWVYRENEAFRRGARALVKPETIVVSHHLPSPQSSPAIFLGARTNRFFVSDETKLILERQPRLWMHGHTHIACDYLIGNTHVICNPYGYPKEREGKLYPPVVLEV